MMKKLSSHVLLSGLLSIFIAAPIGWYSLTLFHMSPGIYLPSQSQFYGLFFSMLVGVLIWFRNLCTFSR